MSQELLAEYEGLDQKYDGHSLLDLQGLIGVVIHTRFFRANTNCNRNIPEKPIDLSLNYCPIVCNLLGFTKLVAFCCFILEYRK